MTPKPNMSVPSRMALIVHSDMGALSGLQTALSAKGFTAIVARDLPTALLAITHHYFEVAIVSSTAGRWLAFCTWYFRKLLSALFLLLNPTCSRFRRPSITGCGRYTGSLPRRRKWWIRL